jgi:glucose-6-phosphate isomerase
MNTWSQFDSRFFKFSAPEFSLDLSRVRYPDAFLERMEGPMQQAFSAMKALEGGAIANPDEQRMVGHYWLRRPDLAPTKDLTDAICGTLDKIGEVAEKVHSGAWKGAHGYFEHLLIIGIGGSALGPQFVDRALRQPGKDRLVTHYFDNTDPDGMDLVLSDLRGKLGVTLCLVISKSGGTPETRNGMLEAQEAYRRQGLSFAQHAIAVTGEGSKLDQVAKAEAWLDRFPMWDWVGGRTSELAVVGLLPAALQGLDFRGLVAGAAAMDGLTRIPRTRENPAALLALMWFFLTDGVGSRDMVILPYKDRLELFSKYLQQLVMESIGKELDLNGKVVNQGIAVYGNKGSTDQHAYVQQLREGLLNFFAVFIEVLKEREGNAFEVDPGATSGDYLQGFYLGTRDALFEKGRQSITITIAEVNAESVGALIALFERTVGYYANLVGINAYHQPGVEAGKKAAAGMLAMKLEIDRWFAAHPGVPQSAVELAAAIGRPDDAELVYKLLLARCVNRPNAFSVSAHERPSEARFTASAL